MALNTTSSSSSTQTNTQSPQVSSGGNTGNISGNLQPGISYNLLNGGSGEPLHATALSTVALGPNSVQATTATTTPPQTTHHFSLGLLSLPLLLLIIAAVSVWSTKRSV